MAALDLASYQQVVESGIRRIGKPNLEGITQEEILSKRDAIEYSKPFLKAFLGAQSLTVTMQAVVYTDNGYIIAMPLSVAVISLLSAGYDLYRNNRNIRI